MKLKKIPKWLLCLCGKCMYDVDGGIDKPHKTPTHILTPRGANSIYQYKKNNNPSIKIAFSKTEIYEELYPLRLIDDEKKMIFIFNVSSNSEILDVLHGSILYKTVEEHEVLVKNVDSHIPTIVTKRHLNNTDRNRDTDEKKLEELYDG